MLALQPPGHERFHCPDWQRSGGWAPPAGLAPPTPSAAAPAASLYPTSAAGAHSALVASASAPAPAPGLSSPCHRVLVSHATASAAVLTAAACPVGDAVVDPGATSKVTGAAWLCAYIAALPPALRVSAVGRSVAVLFRFGHARRTLADRHWKVPICLGGRLKRLGVYVVPGDLPLLLSRPALRAATAVLDLVCD